MADRTQSRITFGCFFDRTKQLSVLFVDRCVAELTFSDVSSAAVCEKPLD